MITDNKKQILNQLVVGLSPVELTWLSGYLSGLTADKNFLSVTENHKNITDNLTIIYATESGNSKYLATLISTKIKERKINVKLKAANQYRPSDLEKENYLIFVISTQGDGEFPDAGKKLAEYIWQNQLNLEKLNYLVIALGDSNYPLFCQSGKNLDQKLAELKAIKLAKIIELDLDFEQRKNEVLNIVENILNGSADTNLAPLASSEKNNKSHYIGKIISNINLTDTGSSKEIRHIEIAFDDEINFEPGDAAGIIFHPDGEDSENHKFLPRLYSIASSHHENSNEIHLTVSVVKYIDENGAEQKGLFSNYLAALQSGEEIKFYINKNRQFKLPVDDKNIIMVGAGTGIAPFRAFLSERNYRSATGKNWLFFGERNFISDFLYQTEWQAHLESGLLSKMDVAFSRDSDHKIYVQDKLQQNAFELYQWLENGAYFYVCGDKKNMAKDVENCLIGIIANQGNKSLEAAENYLENLSEQGRYLKDIY